MRDPRTTPVEMNNALLDATFGPMAKDLIAQPIAAGFNSLDTAGQLLRGESFVDVFTDEQGRPDVQAISNPVVFTLFVFGGVVAADELLVSPRTIPMESGEYVFTDSGAAIPVDDVVTAMKYGRWLLNQEKVVMPTEQQLMWQNTFAPTSIRMADAYNQLGRRPLNNVTLGSSTGVSTVSATDEGAFSITEYGWQGYPQGTVPRPVGPFRILPRDEWLIVRAAADQANKAIHAADTLSFAEKQIHEIQPVKFGGSPTDFANKVALNPGEHLPYTRWWAQLQLALSR